MKKNILRTTTILVVTTLLVSISGHCLFAQTTSGLVSVWAAEGDATDSFGSNDGVLANGTSFTDGTAGAAFHFDGVDDMVLIPDDPSLKPNQVSVATWVKFDSLDSTRYGGAIGCCSGLQYIVFKRNSRIGNFEGYTLYKGGGNWLGFEVTAADGTKGGTASYSFVEVGKWYHVVGTYDGQYSRIYVNGRLERERFHGLPLDHSSQPLVIGRTGEDGGVGESNFDAALAGAADDIRVYNHALSNSEVYDLFVSGSKQKIEALAAFVVALNLHQGIDNSLDAKLRSAIDALDNLNAKNDQAACNSLQAFINAVAAQTSSKIASEDADALINQALAIMNLICPQ